jgi:GntR family transcriptional regulator
MNSTILAEPGISFSLDQENGVPIYRQVIQQIEYAILSGRMRCGDKLPTIRSLAVELKINPNTIAKAYNELEIRGILSTQVGSGTFISDKKPEGETDVRQAKIREVFNRFVQDMADLGADRAVIVEMCRSLQDRDSDSV